MKRPRLSEPRDRNRTLRVVVSDRERADIEAKAKIAALSVSAYLRRLGTGWEPRSTLDSEAVLNLVRVNADQGRLGGLLKMWLVDRPGRGASEAEVRQILNQVLDLQIRLAEIAGRV